MSIEQVSIGFGFLMGAVTGLCFTLAFAVDPLKKEAVERGYAEWIVDASGDATWQWKEAAK